MSDWEAHGGLYANRRRPSGELATVCREIIVIKAALEKQLAQFDQLERGRLEAQDRNPREEGKEGDTIGAIGTCWQ